jgi:hypothetical protein
MVANKAQFPSFLFLGSPLFFLSNLLALFFLQLIFFFPGAGAAGLASLGSLAKKMPKRRIRLQERRREELKGVAGYTFQQYSIPSRIKNLQ